MRAALESASRLCDGLRHESDAGACLVGLIGRVELSGDGISLTLGIEIPCSRAGVRTNSILNLSRSCPLK